MVQLNLDAKDAEALAHILNVYMSDLRFEIADTDRFALREQLKDVENEIKGILEQLSEQGIILDVSVEAMDLLGERGYDHTYGARPLRRIIQNLIEDPLAEGLLDSRFAVNTTIRVEVEEDLLKLVPVEELAAVS